MQLSNEKLIELIQGGVFPMEHMEQLYNQNKGLIIKLIKNTVGSSSPLVNDLLQEGYIILCSCVQHFDPAQGVKFSAYYGNALKFGIYKYSLANNAVKIPGYVMSKVAEFKQLQQTDATDQDILKVLNITAHELDLLRIASRKPLSLDKPLNSDDGKQITVADTLADSSAEFEYDVINSIDDKILYNLCKKVLNNNEFSLVEYRYWHQMAYTAIAETMQLPYHAVKTLKNSSLRKLRYNKYIRNYYNSFSCYHVGINEFNTTHTSEVEKAVINRYKYNELLNNI